MKPEEAAVADVRERNLAPRQFRTRVAGLFFFVPVMGNIDLARVAGDSALPGSEMIPAEPALRSILALKLIGLERKSHVMNLVLDQGLALFAGLNAIPKRAYLAAYSSGIGQQTNQRLMQTWFRHVQDNGLPLRPAPWISISIPCPPIPTPNRWTNTMCRNAAAGKKACWSF